MRGSGLRLRKHQAGLRVASTFNQLRGQLRWSAQVRPRVPWRAVKFSSTQNDFEQPTHIRSRTCREVTSFYTRESGVPVSESKGARR